MTDKLIGDKLIEEAVLSGVPEFLDIPEEMQAKIAQAVLAKERFFWLANSKVPQNEWTIGLLRRAIYAEQRVLETEYMLGEMGLICEGARKRVEELENGMSDLAEATGKDDWIKKFKGGS